MVIEDKITSQMQLLGISKYPFTSKELSDHFRKQILKYHPDKYKEEDTEEKTIAIIEAYNELKSYTDDFIKNKINKTIKEKSIFDFTKPCKWCNGKGYVIKSVKVKGYDCIKCRDTNYFTVKCDKCEGGIFTLRSGRKVDCRACKGTGIFKMKCNHTISFSQMFWYGIFNNKSEFIEKKVKCEYCDGAGEKSWEPINPVIKKGAILK